jgi:hypothetical protein
MKRTAALALIVYIAVMAMINVPWALTRMQWRGDVPRVGRIVATEVPTARRHWPSSTPHPELWPAPHYWHESTLFGWRYFNVRSESDSFIMQVQQLGWPWPVIEQKQMWWKDNIWQLRDVQSDPTPSLKLEGLILNPIVVGIAVWIVVLLPWLLANAIHRKIRRRRGKCLDCGYPVGTSSICTECGERVC